MAEVSQIPARPGQGAAYGHHPDHVQAVPHARAFGDLAVAFHHAQHQAPAGAGQQDMQDDRQAHGQEQSRVQAGIEIDGE